MKDKKNFGEYIAQKRKSLHLTQEELANRLYVLPTTVSKWERGITYPDITMVHDLCQELKISEHEFFLACDDTRGKETKRKAQKYTNLVKIVRYILAISYLIALVACFVSNLAIDKKVSWFYIVFVALIMAFTFTNVMFYLKEKKVKNYIIKILGIETILTYLLIFTCNLYIGGSFLLASFGVATFEFILLWFGIFLFSILKPNAYTGTAIILLLAVSCTLLSNPICEKILNVPSKSNNLYNQIAAGFMVIVAVTFLILGKHVKKK